MEQTIKTKLLTIEAAHKIKILYACESGSRAWQFPSTDSDYDVRFMYVRPYKYYLSVQERSYDLHFPITDESDIYGWDIRKVLQLMQKSNTTPFEWLQSPIVYKPNEEFQQALWQLSQHYFGRRSNIHHYLGIARGAMKDLTQNGEIKIKKLFYVLRPLLAARWCWLQNKIAPMSIVPLMGQLPASLQMEIDELIQVKATVTEGFVVTVSDSLQSFIKEEMATLIEATTDLDKNYFDTDRLDDFFVQTIIRYDY